MLTQLRRYFHRLLVGADNHITFLGKPICAAGEFAFTLLTTTPLSAFIAHFSAFNPAGGAGINLTLAALLRFQINRNRFTFAPSRPGPNFAADRHVVPTRARSAANY